MNNHNYPQRPETAAVEQLLPVHLVSSLHCVHDWANTAAVSSN